MTTKAGGAPDASRDDRPTDGTGDPAEDAELAGLSYEDARNELRDIVSRLESGGQPLEESLALWQRGERLAALCQRWLDGARTRLDAAIEATDAARDRA